MTVPYVPTLGLVHPEACHHDLFQAVVGLVPGMFLPYDRGRQWAERKDEVVLAEHLQHGPDLTEIATLSQVSGGRVSVYHYVRTAPYPQGALRRAMRLRDQYGAAAARVVYFQTDRPRQGTVYTQALLALTAEQTAAPDRPILELHPRSAAHHVTPFLEFSGHVGDRGMAHLGRLWASGHVRYSVLLAMVGRRVVGAIGPMRTWPCPTGTRQLVPQYFAVLPEERHAGFGRALWRAAQQWGRRAGAAYQVLQAAAGSPAEQLYRSEGLQQLGYVCTIRAAPRGRTNDDSD